MSAKTSPSSSRDASVAGPVQIKKELPSDEIKEFAHSTMNELLGWYGFDGVDVDRLDLTAKTSRLLQSAAAAAAASQQHQLDQQQQQQQQQLLERRRTGLLRSSRTSLAAAYHSNNNNNNNSSSNSNGNAVGRKVGGMQNCNRTTAATPSDHDTRSSREDDSKSPNSIGKPVTTAGLVVPPTEEKIDFNNCCWCHRPIAENAPDYLTSSDGPRYCSESCFTQSRRACFKKAKTCDWCKHVRHAVSYVDFQDGASQLQFCSEKCLNQYKMQIFCNETQAHLDMNPHLRDQGLEAGSEAGLITPDLWLRNCRSRSASPASTVSVSPGPAAAPERTAATPHAKRSSPSVTPPSNPSKPLISVAPVSKLLAQKSPAPAAAAPPPPPPPLQRHQHSNNSSLASGRDSGLKHGRRKRPLRGPGSTSSGSETVASMLQKQQQQPPTLSADFSGSSVPLPPLSPMPEPHHPQQQQQQQQPPPVVPQQVLGRGPTAIPSSYFATPPNGHPMGLPFGRHPAPPPHHFMPPPHGMMPRGYPPPFGLPMPQAQVPEHLGAFGAMLGAVPPVTVMVPYPIIIPLPIPIPVPLPVMDFYKAHLTPEQRKRFDEERATTSRRSKEELPQPLDCSKSRSEQEQEQEQQLDPAPQEEQKATMLKEEQLDDEEEDDKEKEKEKDEDVQVDDDDNDDEGKKSIPKTNSAGRASPDSASPSSPASSSPATDANSSQETHCIVRDETQSESNQDSQKLPKLKITRLQSKRTLNQTKEEPNASVPAAATPAGSSSSSSSAASECSRPLRKRKRIIDCDFQKMALRELEPSDGQNQQQDEDVECNNINNSNSQGSGNAKAKK